MEKAMRSSCATTLPVWSESNTLKILFITTSASHLNKEWSLEDCPRLGLSNT